MQQVSIEGFTLSLLLRAEAVRHSEWADWPLSDPALLIFLHVGDYRFISSIEWDDYSYLKENTS